LVGTWPQYESSSAPEEHGAHRWSTPLPEKIRPSFGFPKIAAVSRPSVFPCRRIAANSVSAMRQVPLSPLVTVGRLVSSTGPVASHVSSFASGE
jgi:hypothetical protein